MGRRATLPKAREISVRLEEHLGLVHLIALRLRGGSLELDELEGIGVMGMIEAAERFDASRGVQFGTYATWWIRQHMINALKKRSAELASILSLEKKFNPGPGGDGDAHDEDRQCLGDLLEAHDTTEQDELRDEVAALLAHLPATERRVIELRYQVGTDAEYGVEDIPLTYTEVGRRLGMTADLVKKTEERALMKMRYWGERGAQLATRVADQ